MKELFLSTITKPSEVRVVKFSVPVSFCLFPCSKGHRDTIQMTCGPKFTYQQCTGKPLLGELGLTFHLQSEIETFCPPQGHLIENSLEFH